MPILINFHLFFYQSCQNIFFASGNHIKSKIYGKNHIILIQTSTKMQQDQYYNTIYPNSTNRVVNKGPQIEISPINQNKITDQSHEIIGGQNQLGDKKPEYVSGHEEYHISVGEYLKSGVYGGTDGVINSLAVIIGGIASGTLPSVIFAIGVSVIVGDGIGMGLGDYLSAKAEKQFIKSEEKRQFWQVENRLEDQKNEIVEIYKEKNYSDTDAKRLAELFSTNHQAFVNVMMLEELGLVVDDSNPVVNGIVNTISFMILGFIPLIPYLVAKINGDEEHQYIWVIGIGAFQLFSLGFVKSTLIGSSIPRRFFSAFETIFFASIALAAGYGIGKIFEH